MKWLDVDFSNKKDLINPTLIIIHKDLTPNATKEELHQSTLERLGGFPYHFRIRFDGTVEGGRPINKQGAHCYEYNDKSIGIAFEGSPEDEITYSQYQSAGLLLAKIRLYYGYILTVTEHRKLYTTDCPFNFELKKLMQVYVEEKEEIEKLNDFIDFMINHKDSKYSIIRGKI